MSDFAGLPVAAGSDVDMDQGRLDKINDVMAAAVADGQVPGAATVVARHGKVVHSNVVGNLDLDARDGRLSMNS